MLCYLRNVVDVSQWFVVIAYWSFGPIGPWIKLIVYRLYGVWCKSNLFILQLSSTTVCPNVTLQSKLVVLSEKVERNMSECYIVDCVGLSLLDIPYRGLWSPSRLDRLLSPSARQSVKDNGAEQNGSDP